MIVIREWDSRWDCTKLLKHHYKGIFLLGFIPVYIRVTNY